MLGLTKRIDREPRSLLSLAGRIEGRHDLKAEWRQVCESAKTRQEGHRTLKGFKDRLQDPRVTVTMTELWEDAIELYGRYCETLKRSFLLSSHKVYTHIPLATCRIRPCDGSVVIRKDVQIILEKGICRTEKLGQTRFHSLISFKSGDLKAMYIRVLPDGPMMALFMTRFEGPVVFFFADRMALRVILVLMQTKFIEVLHSPVPENDVGTYAMKVLSFCEAQRVAQESSKKQEFVELDLCHTGYPDFFDHSGYAEREDNWSEDDSEAGSEGEWRLS